MRKCILLGMFLTFMGFGWALSPDATREQVIAELGKPSSVAKLGVREILVYPKGVRVELEGGKVVAAKGIVLTDETAAPVEPAAGPQPASAKKQEKVVPTAEELEQQKIAAEDAAAEREYDLERAKAQAAMEKAVEGLERSHEMAQRPPPPKGFELTGFAVEMVLKLLLTIAALKLACKYWGAEVFWSGILTVAAADVGVRGSMALFGTLVLGFPTLFYADEAVAAIVMVLLLKKLSINHSIVQAVELTVTTKTFSIVVGSLLVTILLRALH